MAREWANSSPRKPIKQPHMLQRRPGDCAPLRVRRYLCTESGQALVEAPVALLVLCFVILVLLQPTVTLMTQLVFRAALDNAARVVSVTPSDTSSQKAALNLYVLHSLSVLPESSYFFDRATLKIATARSGSSLRVRVSAQQRVLPLIGGWEKRTTRPITCATTLKIFDDDIDPTYQGEPLHVGAVL